jgi:hypothetical protein
MEGFCMAEIKCPSCGADLIGGKYCSACGASLQPGEPTMRPDAGFIDELAEKIAPRVGAVAAAQVITKLEQERKARHDARIQADDEERTREAEGQQGQKTKRSIWEW